MSVNSKQKIKKSYAEQVSEKIIGAIESGTAPWLKSWRGEEIYNTAPYNGTTGNPYNGMNAVNLMVTAVTRGYEDPRWITYKQANSIDAQVKKGEKGTTIQYWKYKDRVDVLDEEGNVILDSDGQPKKETVKLENPKVYYATVFNAHQIDNMPKLEIKSPLDFKPNDLAEKILENSGAIINHKGGDSAFYSPTTDEIVLPLKKQFVSEAQYYSTALHELGHWTGHESRLNRDMSGGFGSESYAKEELRAEIASFMLSSRIGIDFEPGNHFAYIENWLSVLKDDNREIFRASRDAEKIADYVQELEYEKVQEKPLYQVKKDDIDMKKLIDSIEKKKIDTLNPSQAKYLISNFSIKQYRFSNNNKSESYTIIQSPLNKEKYSIKQIYEEGDVYSSIFPKNAYDKDFFESQKFNFANVTQEKFKALEPNRLLQEIDSFLGTANFIDKDSIIALAKESSALERNETVDFLKKRINILPDGQTHMKLSELKSSIETVSIEISRQSTVFKKKTYLTVPYSEKEAAKKAGAKWDKDAKSWFAPEGVSKERLEKWLPKESIAMNMEDSLDKKEERNLKEVPKTKEYRGKNMYDEKSLDDALDRKTFLYVPYEEKEAAKQAGAKWDAKIKTWYAPKGTKSYKIKEWLPKNQELEIGTISSTALGEDPTVSFREELEKRGYELRGDPIADGRIHRVHITGHKGSSKNGSYAIHQDGRPVMWVKDWKNGTEETIKHSQSNYRAGADDKAISIQKDINRIKAAQQELDRSRMQYAVSQRLNKEYSSLPLPNTDFSHPYTDAKKVRPRNAKLDTNNNLLIAFRNINDEIKTVQRISAEQKNGSWSKYWEKGGEKNGNFAIIGAKDFTSFKHSGKSIILAEGYATAMSVYDASKDNPVIVVGDSGNISAVAKNILQAMDRNVPIIIASDNDMNNPKNPGLSSATRVAQEIKDEFGKDAVIVKPIFTNDEIAKGLSDFNDLSASRGNEAVKKQIASQLQVAYGKQNETKRTQSLEAQNRKDYSKKEDKSQNNSRELGL